MVGFYLVIFAFALLIIEAHVPSFGILGLAAIVSLLAGGKMIVDAGGVFGIAVDWWTFIGIATTMAIIVLIASRIVAKSLHKKPVAGIEAMIGTHAHIVEWFGTTGRVMAQGELWQAASLNPYSFKDGDTVEITSIKDLVLHIHPLK